MSSGGRHEREEGVRRRALDDLARNEAASESVLGGTIGRARAHFGGADAPEGDSIELWGRRIGRIMSAIAVLVLLYYLAVTYL